jgi:hypothetical protein
MNRLQTMVMLAVALQASAPVWAAPISNQQFSEQVRDLRRQMAQDQAAVESASLLCVNLPAHRSADEPRCVALRLHFRAQASARRSEEQAICLPPSVSRLITQIAGAA